MTRLFTIRWSYTFPTMSRAILACLFALSVLGALSAVARASSGPGSDGGGGSDHDDDSGGSGSDDDDSSDRSGSSDDDGSGDDNSSGSDDDSSGSHSGSGSDSDDRSGSNSGSSHSGSNSGPGSSSSGSSENAHGGNAGSRHERGTRLDRDEDGERIVGGEVVMVSSLSSASGRVKADDLEVLEAFQLPSLDMQMIRVAVPDGTPAEDVMKRLRRIDPNAVVTFNHVYAPAAGAAAGA
jgi:hypothetical protein